MQTQKITLTNTIPPELTGKRLDQAVSLLFPEYSRTIIQHWIKSGNITVDGETITLPKNKVNSSQYITVNADIIVATDWKAQPIDLDIIYADDEIIVVNKAAGVVVHPALGNLDNTLVNALLHYAPELSNLPRAGIIHRLDKDTSGLLVIARTLPAHTKLVTELQNRNIKREYEAIVNGIVIAGGTVNAPMGRHSKDRKKMAVIINGKTAITHYRVIKKFRAHTHLRINLETGRTHQIRVHMAHIHFPIVADKTYGDKLKIPMRASQELKVCLHNFKRQALHAKRLGLIHPKTLEYMEWETPLPDDMNVLLGALNNDNL